MQLDKKNGRGTSRPPQQRLDKLLKGCVDTMYRLHLSRGLFALAAMSWIRAWRLTPGLRHERVPRDTSNSPTRDFARLETHF